MARRNHRSKRSRWTGVLFLLLALAGGGAGWGAEPANGGPSVPYRARLKGLRRGDLKVAVQAQSLTLLLAERPPATLRQLQKRAEDDLPAMMAALRAAGYLDGTVAVEIETNRAPFRATFRVQKGPRYRLGRFAVAYEPASAEIPRLPRRAEWGRHPVASVENVEAAEQAALRHLRQRGYPQPRLRGRTVERDSTRRRVDVRCVVEPGAAATLGPVAVDGRVRVPEAYVQNRVPWKPGARYDVEKLENFEKDLLRSGLFSSVRPVVAGEPDAAGDLPVRVALAERAWRTVRTGVSYYTDEGFGGQASWENRNWLGHAESLGLTLSASEILYEAKGLFTRPDVWVPNLDLHLEVGASDEHPDAYRSREVHTTLWLEKRLGRKLTLKGGLAQEQNQVRQQGTEVPFSLLSVPLSADWDLRDDKWDPSRGAAFFLGATPYRNVGDDLDFIKYYGEASFFLPLVRSPRVGMALRGGLGSIAGAETKDVPADKRFYAGGGGTIRGYPYQSVGELTEAGQPTGGNSLATVSAELRARASRTLGLAAFVDGGTAYPGSQPDGDVPFLWGAGGGLRYYLGSMPLRVDLAFPLQRRAGVDDPFQIYFSLGQAF